MQKYLIGIAFAVVVGLAAFFFFRKDGAIQVTICSDDIRSREATVTSSLSSAAKNLEEVKVALEGEESSTYGEQLTKITPTDLLALKTCDTQCKLLERCLSKSNVASVADACPTEYRDYQERVKDSLTLIAEVEQYEKETEEAVTQAKELKRTRELLAEASSGTAGTGTNAAVLRQNLALQKQTLASRVKRIDNMAEKVLVKR